ncbi:MAG: 50S ribosomal protein L29 [Flavobacteriales bacterium]|jgi:large subunit ribosomal protein L29|nr:50S ribosomal protein L29 [Flavobacteriales bacterium]MBT6965081.1 50S ribosomal protein L29 [Flavobacteriales bacterium]|tara:strand:- start:555 stop:752 length:198 start_codon:yes stop_codon:yes gene_type:complete
MKAQVLTDMPENELHDLLVTEREKLIKMKMSHAVSPMENPLQIKFTRKAIARVMTELSNRRNTSK